MSMGVCEYDYAIVAIAMTVMIRKAVIILQL